MVTLSSRTQLSNLKYPLAEGQLTGIIFADEREEAKKKIEGRKYSDLPYLVIEFYDEVSWKNEWLAFWPFDKPIAVEKSEFL